jgi:hypothetical protein
MTADTGMRRSYSRCAEAPAAPATTWGSFVGGADSGSVATSAVEQVSGSLGSDPVGVGSNAHSRKATALVALSYAEVVPTGRSTPHTRPDLMSHNI